MHLYIPVGIAVIFKIKNTVAQGKLVIETEKEVNSLENIKIILNSTENHILLPILKGKSNNIKVFIENWHLLDELEYKISKKAFIVAVWSADMCVLPDLYPKCLNLIDNMYYLKHVVLLEDMKLNLSESWSIIIFNTSFNNARFSRFIDSFSIFSAENKTIPSDISTKTKIISKFY